MLLAWTVPQHQGCRRPRQLQLVQASVFGVGAPEAILVGVVALLVFGPKGLAQAAKSLGQTLRAFQPTIRELTQVSAELKSTLESEIGINEIKEELRRPVTSVSRALDETISGTGTGGAANSAPVQGAGLQELADGMTAQVKGAREDMARVVDPDIERKREEAAKQAWGAAAGSAAAAAPAPSVKTDASGSGSRGSAAEPAVQLDSLSVEQLEAELQRRKAAVAAAQQQQGLGGALVGARRHGVRRPAGRRLTAVPSAAAASSAEQFDFGVDIKALLKDSLEAPKKAAQQPPASVEVPAAAQPAAAVDALQPAGPVPDLPGTEILPSPVPTTPAPAAVFEKVELPNAPQSSPIQGFDFEAFTSNTTQQAAKAISKVSGAAEDSAAAAAKALSKVTGTAEDSAAATAKQLGDTVDSLLGGGSPSAAVSQASEAASQAAGAVTGAVSDAAAALTQGLGGLGGATSGIGGSVGQAADALSQSVGGAASALSGTFGGAASTLGGTVSQAAGAAGSAVSAATGAVSGFTDRVNSVYGEEIEIIKDNLGTATKAVQSGVAAAQQAVDGVVGQALEILPDPLKYAMNAAASAAASAVRDAAGKALATPEGTAVAAGVAVGLPAYLIWQAAFAGFSGSLDPEDAYDVLQTQSAVLVDVRSEAQRLQNGIAELRRGALGKGAAVPPVQLPPSLSRRVRGSDALALEIQGTLIASLAKVGSSTKVIIMDNQGERAKAVARAAARAGVRSYVLQGGFRAWQDAGLRVRQGTTDYDASVVEAVEDQVEAVAEVASEQVSRLRNPATAATAAAGAAALGYTAFNIHTVLQFVGVVGLELTLFLKFLEYDSPEEALEDLQQFVGKLSKGVSGATSLLPSRGSTSTAGSKGSSSGAAAAKPAAALGSGAAPVQPASGDSLSRMVVANSDDE
ncbi:hypothetical protein N2152v2_010601 [Parachlorella kessleri]